MNLDELYVEITKTKAMADKNFEDQPLNIRAGMEGRIRAARESLAKLVSDYKTTAVKSSAIIALSGEYGKQFADLSTEFNVLSFDFSQGINTIIEKIMGREGKKEFDNAEFFLLLSELNIFKVKYGLSSLPPVNMQSSIIGKPTGEAIKRLLGKSYVSQINSVVIRSLIGEKAYETGFSGKIIPVALYNTDDDIDTVLLNRPVAVLPVTESVDRALVISTLNSVKAALQGHLDVQIEEVAEEIIPVIETKEKEVQAKPKKKGGRPKGSKNKTKKQAVDAPTKQGV